MSVSPTSSTAATSDGWARAEIELGRCRVLIHTKATGLLARFAHNLELEATKLEIAARFAGERWTAELGAPVRAMRVVGVLRGERVHQDLLSRSDEEEIQRRIREQVFVGVETVRVQAAGEAPERGEATVTLAARQQTVALRPSVKHGASGELVVSGRCTLSLGKLGVPEVKGPLGAFRVFDDVEILYSFVVRRPADPS
jgi:hypothetical protein